MHSVAPEFFTSPTALWRRFGGPRTPLVIDAMTPEAAATLPGQLPTARPLAPDAVAPELARRQAQGEAADVVVACLHGEKRSQILAARLRAQGVPAAVLEGGLEAWRAAGLPLVPHAALARWCADPMPTFVTRRRPKIDRIACPWLIARFIAPQAEFLYVDPPQVLAAAGISGAVPFDVPGVELTHEAVEGEDHTSFDTILDRFGLAGVPALATLARIVRGADTGRFDIAPAAAGLAAVSFGLSALAGDDDHAALRHGFVIYDALYAHARDAAHETHGWPPAPSPRDAGAR